MKKFLTCLLFVCLSLLVLSQEAPQENRGTVKVQKKGQLSKVYFDDVNYRLVGIDRSGNVLDSAVVSFEMSVTIKGIAYTESTVGPGLSYQMQQLLARCDRTSKIFFEKIEAKDKYGTRVKMPSFQHTLWYSDEDND